MQLQTSDAPKNIPAFTPHASSGPDYHYPVAREHDDPFDEFEPLFKATMVAKAFDVGHDKSQRFIFAWAYLQYLNNPTFRSRFPSYTLDIEPKPIQVSYTRPGLGAKQSTQADTDQVVPKEALLEDLRKTISARLIAESVNGVTYAFDWDPEVGPYIKLLKQRKNLKQPLQPGEFRFTLKKVCSKQYPADTIFTTKTEPKDNYYWQATSTTVVSPATGIADKWYRQMQWENHPPIPAHSDPIEQLASLGKLPPSIETMQAVKLAFRNLQETYPLPDISTASDIEILNHAHTIWKAYQAYYQRPLETKDKILAVLPNWTVIIKPHDPQLADYPYAGVPAPTSNSQIPANTEETIQAMNEFWERKSLIKHYRPLTENLQGRTKTTFASYYNQVIVEVNPGYLLRIENILNPPPPVVPKAVDPFNL